MIFTNPGVATLSVLLLAAAVPCFGDTALTRERTVTTVAPGAHMIRHKDAPNGIPNGNTEVIIGEKEVLVVDSCYLASEAKQDIAQIRVWTEKPVRYLPNTHWHNDHTMRNATYAAAYPDVSIIAHRDTRTMMKGYLSRWYARHTAQIATLKDQLATGKGEGGKALTEAQLSEARNDLSGEEKIVEAFPNFVPRLPDMTFERELNLDLGNRPVEIKYLGRGNTPGDAVVFLPRERMLIAGDIVVHPIPYLCSGYPSEWAETLHHLIDFNPPTIIPGHGEVLHDLTYPTQVRELLSSVVAQVRQALYVQGNGKPLEDVRKQVEKNIDFESLRRQFDGGNPENFDQSSAIPNCLVRSAYYEEVLR